MIPFTYLIKHVPTNRYYYGVRFKKGCHPYDLWTKYFTSSRKIKGLIKRYGKKSFTFEIRKTFKTIKQAINWEHKVLRRMKVIYRNDFLNQTDNKSIDPKVISKANLGRVGYMKGKKHKQSTKNKISKRTKGKNNPRYGVLLEDKQKKKISNSLKKWFKNPNNTHPWLGRKHSKKTIEKFKKNNKGKNNPRYGVTLTLAHKRKLLEGRNKYYAERKSA